MNRTGKIKLGVVFIGMLLVLLVSQIGQGGDMDADLGLPEGSSAVQVWDNTATFTLIRNKCTSPVSCEAEFTVLPSKDLILPESLITLSSDVFKGSIDSLEIYEKICVNEPIYNSYSICSPYEETVEDLVNGTGSHTIIHNNCTVMQGPQIGTKDRCSLNPLVDAINLKFF